MTTGNKSLTIFGRHFDLWYDRSVRVWFAIEVDANGFQIGDTIDSIDRDTLLTYIGARAVHQAATTD